MDNFFGWSHNLVVWVRFDIIITWGLLSSICRCRIFISRETDFNLFTTLWVPWDQRWPTIQVKSSQGIMIPDSKVHGVDMGPTWVLSAPDGPHVGPINLAIRDVVRKKPDTKEVKLMRGQFVHIMMSWHGNAFRITAHLWRDSTGHWWNPSQKASDTGLW